MGLFSRIAKKIARRFRAKGMRAKEINWTGRNFRPLTAVDLWEQKYRFRETPPARAGTKRRFERERRQKREGRTA